MNSEELNKKGLGKKFQFKTFHFLKDIASSPGQIGMSMFLTSSQGNSSIKGHYTCALGQPPET